MSVLDRSELEQSHLADLHAIASELGIESYRRLGRAALIDAILAGDGGGDGAAEPESPEPVATEAADEEAKASGGRGRSRGRRLRLRRGRDEEEAAPTEVAPDADDGAEVVLPEGDDSESTAPPAAEVEDAEAEVDGDEPEVEGDEPAVKKRPERRPRGRQRREPDDGDGDGGGQEDTRAGILDILPGGSGFMRADPFVHASEDAYVSPAQIRRCNLRSGDELSGPVRPPRRSERYPSLVRVETVNGQPADETAERPLFDDLTPTFAAEPLETVHGLTFGKGSRVAIGGPPGAGATRLLREVTTALEGDLDVMVVLSGVRPEEVTDWRRMEGLAIAGGGFDQPADALGQITEMAVERAKRIAERGADAVLVIDGLDALNPAVARRVFGAARNTEEAGSLTIVAATGSGGELQRLATTRVVLTADGGLDQTASGTLREDLLGG
ncbi:MAG TPA: Rho termination factor N-terminal domain-containing protein [Thermoleophilaceae bacterium]|nr:Rho termination factor N-terminal domain-containing protein [Thermoleophilaceae bacterium]